MSEDVWGRTQDGRNERCPCGLWRRLLEYDVRRGVPFVYVSGASHDVFVQWRHYILYSLYAAHPIIINPFRSVFIEVFVRERDAAQIEADRGGVSDSEQLVWVLWKILKGDGNDVRLTVSIYCSLIKFLCVAGTVFACYSGTVTSSTQAACGTSHNRRYSHEGG